MHELKTYTVDSTYSNISEDYEGEARTYFYIDGEEVSFDTFVTSDSEWSSEHEKTFSYDDEENISIYVDTNVEQSFKDCWSALNKRY